MTPPPQSQTYSTTGMTDMKRRNTRKLPLDALIPRIEEVNEYIREGMKQRMIIMDDYGHMQQYRPITVNRTKQTVTFHSIYDLGDKEKDVFDAKTKSEISEIRENLTEMKRRLTILLQRLRDKKLAKRFTKNPRKAKKPTPKKSAYTKAWYEDWPKIDWLSPVVVRGRSTWGAPIVVSYDMREDMGDIDIEIFPDGKSGKLRVKGEMSSHHYGEDWEQDKIDKRGLTKKQAIAAVREFLGG